MNLINAHIAVLAAVVVLASQGCGNKQPPLDLFVLVQDAAGLVVGTEVQWRGAPVGNVVGITPDEHGIRLDVLFTDENRNKFHLGLTARPHRGMLGGVPILVLYGGDDMAMPVIAAGAEIPEATLTSTLPPKLALYIGAGLIVVIIVWSLVRVFSKVLAFGLAMALMCLSGWLCYHQYLQNRTAFSGSEIEVAISMISDKLAYSPEASAFWQEISAQYTRLLQEAHDKGTDIKRKLLEELKSQVKAEADKLTARGNKQAATELLAAVNALSTTTEESR